MKLIICMKDDTILVDWLIKLIMGAFELVCAITVCYNYFLFPNIYHVQ
jgi:hypothetical protein